MRKQIKKYASKKLKDTIMGTTNHDRSAHADTVIRNHVLWSMGAGAFIWVPIVDIVAATALQLDMVRQLSRVYDQDYNESRGKAIVTTLSSSTFTRVLGGAARSMLKAIPVVGTVLGGATMAIFNGASCYALGQVFKRHFETGGTILDLDPDRLKNLYEEQFEKGKKIVTEWKAEEEAAKAEGSTTTTEPTPDVVREQEAAAQAEASTDTEDSVMDRIRQLAKLRDEGTISEEEFAEMKRKIIASM